MSRGRHRVTLVSGIWDLRREQAGAAFARPFDHYLRHFETLMGALDLPLIVCGPTERADDVWRVRRRSNTEFVVKETADLERGFPLYEKVQAIRGEDRWRGQAAWLAESPQATLPNYSPLVLSKFFMLAEAAARNPFETDFFAWIDGGITHTVNAWLFRDYRLDLFLSQALQRFRLLSFPYLKGNEIHGFPRPAMRDYCGAEVAYVCRGGFFGGHRDQIAWLFPRYERLLLESLRAGYLGTEECLLTILAHRHPDRIDRLDIGAAGSLEPFFREVIHA